MQKMPQWAEVILVPFISLILAAGSLPSSFWLSVKTLLKP